MGPNETKEAIKTKFGSRTQSYHIVHFFLFAVSGIILSQSSHQNHGHQPHQENDHHERVEDGEPVNLKQYFKVLKSHRNFGNLCSQ